MEYHVFIFALCRPYQPEICDTRREHVTEYIHRSLITSLETYRGRCSQLQPPFFSPRPVPSPRYGICDSRGCCSPRCGPGLGRTGSREAEQPTGRPSRRRAGASSSRASERSPVLGESDKSARRRVARHRARARSLARTRRPWRESAFVLSHTLAYAEQRQPWLRPSSASRLLTFLRKSTNRRAVSSTPLRFAERPPLDLLVFLPLMDFRPCWDKVPSEFLLDIEMTMLFFVRTRARERERRRRLWSSKRWRNHFLLFLLWKLYY